jgi:hypothetical protein
MAHLRQPDEPGALEAHPLVRPAPDSTLSSQPPTTEVVLSSVCSLIRVMDRSVDPVALSAAECGGPADLGLREPNLLRPGSLSADDHPGVGVDDERDGAERR